MNFFGMSFAGWRGLTKQLLDSIKSYNSNT